MYSGIEAWKNLADIGPIYPFTGTEGVLVLIGVVFWIVWHIQQRKAEHTKHDAAKRAFKNKA